MSTETTEAWWDEQGRGPDARARIHPTGAIGDDAYEESGRAAVERLAPYWQGMSPAPLIVDFGCGDGRVTVPLAASGAAVVGVDTSPAMLARLADRDPTIRTFLADDLAELAGTADYVIALAVLIHHRHHRAAAIAAQATGMLAAGGVAILDLPVGDVSAEPEGPIGVAHWTAHEVDVLAGALGLEVVSHGLGDGDVILRKP